MTLAALAARVAIGGAAIAIGSLAVLHVLNPEIHPRRTMISQYALGRHGWMMAFCFGGFALGSAGLLLPLNGAVTSTVGRIGTTLLLPAAIGLAMAARFPMDPVNTPRSRMSRSGRLHGVAFLLGVPSQLLAVLLVSLVFHRAALVTLAALTWAGFLVMIAIMLKVGPGKEPDPHGPERFLGVPNRLFMIGYGAWLIAAALPLAS